MDGLKPVPFKTRTDSSNSQRAAETIIGDEGISHGRWADLSVECDAGKPASAMAERVPEVAGGDLHGEARGGGRVAGLPAVSVCRTQAVAAISAMADGDEGLRTRGGEALRAGRNRLRKKTCSALRAKGPGLKPLDALGLIQGAEAPCSLPKTKTGVILQPGKSARLDRPQLGSWL